MESTFINGLKQEIQAELLISNPRGLGQIMDQAQRIEDKNKLLRGLGPRSNKPFYSPNRGENKSSDSYLGPNRGDMKVAEAHPTRAVVLNDRGHFPRRERRLTEAEIQERRKKGLCFHCDEKFSLDHRCKHQFNILLVHEDEIVGQDEEEN